MTSRAIITHFDGDPFTLNYWLDLYSKYWRGEADTIYMTVCLDSDKITQEVIDYIKNRISTYHEIKPEYIPYSTPPEQGNKISFNKVKEDYIGFVESDGLIFGKGIVDQMFRLLENEKQDIVAPKYRLIESPNFRGDYNFEGFMRCFFFAKRSILDKIEFDLNPKAIKAGDKIPNSDKQFTQSFDLDCFGWICLQLATLYPKVTYIPGNMPHPDRLLEYELFEQFKWVHIRQMSSSALGIGGKQFGEWRKNPDILFADLLRILESGEIPDPTYFIILKALVFKYIFFDYFKDKEKLGIFAEDYKLILDTAKEAYGITDKDLYEAIGFFRATIKL